MPVPVPVPVPAPVPAAGSAAGPAAGPTAVPAAGSASGSAAGSAAGSAPGPAGVPAAGSAPGPAGVPAAGSAAGPAGGPLRVVVGAAVVRDSRVLAARRATPAAGSGRWELPGGKVEAGESEAEALVREVREELGCEVRVTGRLEGEQPIGDRLTLRVLLAELVGGEPVPHEHQHDALRWLGPESLDDVEWLAPDRPFLGELAELLVKGHRLEDGNLDGVVRVGRTVRRPTVP